jgi:hypothetical protein
VAIVAAAGAAHTATGWSAMQFIDFMSNAALPD